MALTPHEKLVAQRIAKELLDLTVDRNQEQPAADWILEQTKHLSPEEKKKVKVQLILPPRPLPTESTNPSEPVDLAALRHVSGRSPKIFCLTLQIEEAENKP